MAKNKLYLLFILVTFLPLIAMPADGNNGKSDRKRIGMQQSSIPNPHMTEIAEPQAFYTVSTSSLSIELDPVYYSHYTIILQSDYACVDYYVTSPVVNIPVGSLDSVIDIYIESDDCGSYYGTLDQAAYGRSP